MCRLLTLKINQAFNYQLVSTRFNDFCFRVFAVKIRKKWFLTFIKKCAKKKNKIRIHQILYLTAWKSVKKLKYAKMTH